MKREDIIKMIEKEKSLLDPEKVKHFNTFLNAIGYEDLANEIGADAILPEILEMLEKWRECNEDIIDEINIRNG